jgi:hypothetical protein
VPTEPGRRHLITYYTGHIDRILEALGRPDTHIRFVVSGVDEDEDEHD